MKLSKRAGSEADDLVAGLLAGRSASMFVANNPAEEENMGKNSGPVSEWMMPSNNNLERYHDELIGVRALLYEGCELIACIV